MVKYLRLILSGEPLVSHSAEFGATVHVSYYYFWLIVMIFCVSYDTVTEYAGPKTNARFPPVTIT